MSRQCWIIGGVLLAVFAAALSRPAEPAAAAPPEERQFGKDAALRVTRKQAGEAFYLTHAVSVRVGDRAFLHAARVGNPAAVYIPVSEIELIEEFANLDAMKKVYKLEEPPAPPVKTAVGEKK
jgi:hypothetical protein